MRCTRLLNIVVHNIVVHNIVACLILPLCGSSHAAGAPTSERPNILWIVSEDNSPLLGAYGDSFATTPNIDTLAKQSIVFDNAFANSPVCAPTRFSIITGMHANVMGTGNMRSRNKVPDFVKPFTHYLREAGYHVSNNNKTDYNYATADIPTGSLLNYSQWQAIDSKLWHTGSYRDRKPGQPFFHVHNIYESHESRLHTPLAHRQHKPQDVALPPYHPDTAAIRDDWALYYDRLTQMDALVGKKLAELQAAGEFENTIVFYYSDHGGALARSKRFVYDTGTRIPFIVHIPEKFQHLVNQPAVSRSQQLIDVVDLAPTLLYLAGIKKPAHMHGNNIFNRADSAHKVYNYLYRGRMDTRIDLVRALRGKRFKYIRNYMPHRPNGQHIEYLWKAASIRDWQKTCQQNQCNAIQRRFWKPRAAEELYDTQADPWEVNNLANNPDFMQLLLGMREALAQKNRLYKDVGFIPEGELAIRSKENSSYALVREGKLPIARVIETAEIASLAQPEKLGLLVKRLSDPEAAVRYWAAVGCSILKKQALTAKPELIQRLNDNSPDVQIAAAEALSYLGEEQRALPILVALLLYPEPMVRLHAANALDAIGDKAKPVASQLQAMVNRLEKLNEQGKLADETYLLSALAYTTSQLE